MSKRKKLGMVILALLLLCVVTGAVFLLLNKRSNNKKNKNTGPQKDSGVLIQEQGSALANTLNQNNYSYKKEDFSVLVNLTNNLIIAGSYDKAYSAESKIPDSETAERVKTKYELCLYIAASEGNQTKYTDCRSQFLSVLNSRTKEPSFMSLLKGYDTKYSPTFTPVKKPADLKESES